MMPFYMRRRVEHVQIVLAKQVIAQTLLRWLDASISQAHIQHALPVTVPMAHVWHTSCSPSGIPG